MQRHVLGEGPRLMAPSVIFAAGFTASLMGIYTTNLDSFWSLQTFLSNASMRMI
jgi:hypothetical protein